MKWSKEELDYLRENYSSKQVTFNDLKKKLNRSKRAISHQGSRMGLSRPRIPVNKSKDPEHRKIYDKNYYEKHKKRIYRLKKRRVQNRKIELINQLGGKCAICGYNKCPAALEFHHKKTDKEGHVSKFISLSSKQKILKEANKCILLCANCHREVHHKG